MVQKLPHPREFAVRWILGIKPRMTNKA